MHPELEALLKAFEAYYNADPTEAKNHLGPIYYSRLEDAAERLKTSVDALDRAVRSRYSRISRIEDKKPPTIPPKA